MVRSDNYVSGFTKQEREMMYWIFLFIVLLSYLVIIDPALFMSALEDSGIEFAKALMSVQGATCLAVVLVVVCRFTDDGRRAFWYGAALFSLVAIVLILNQFVFPKRLVPVDIDSHDIYFQTPTPSKADREAAKAAPHSEEAKYVRGIDRDIVYGVDDLQNLLGFAFLPIVMIAGFGSMMWCFRIDSGKAFAGTFFVFVIGCAVFFKAMVLDKHSALHASASAESLTTAAGSSSAHLGALARLRGVNAQLDNLLNGGSSHN